MGYDDERALGRAQLVDALGDGLERLDVQARVGLVEDCQLGLQHRELEDLVALLPAPLKAPRAATVPPLVGHLTPGDLVPSDPPFLPYVPATPAAALVLSLYRPS